MPNANDNANTRPDTICSADARVSALYNICREHVAIDVELAGLPPSTPGQFVQIRCYNPDAPAGSICDWPADGMPSLRDPDLLARQPYLRRPFSIADHVDLRPGISRLRLISRSVGVGTRWLKRLQVGDTLNLTGPLGSGFRIPAQQTPAILIGGGVGIPPLLYLARRLAELAWRDVTLICGATTRELLPLILTATPSITGVPQPCCQLPGSADFPATITTDDGSLGLPGRVTDALRIWRNDRPANDAIVFACGPDPMLKALATLTRQFGLPCQLSIERNMGCGIGTCLSCVTRLREPNQSSGWRWGLTCQDGPVFDRDELLDYYGTGSA